MGLGKVAAITLLKNGRKGKNFEDMYEQQLSRNMSGQKKQVKILQFGTGVFLKGFVGDFIATANDVAAREDGADEAVEGMTKNGEAQIVVIKSTGDGATPTGAQPYYLRKRGLVNGEKHSTTRRIDIIAETLHAKSSWELILEYGRSAQVLVVVSNTTELGLNYLEETMGVEAPKSYPAKLTKILMERFASLGDTEESGLIVLPCELLVDNGSILKAAVQKNGEYNGFGTGFAAWVDRRVRFCNTLVDRIVTGMATEAEARKINEAGGTNGWPVIDAEVYALWAIEGDEKLRADLWFCAANDGLVVVAPSIAIHRELKLRLLNGTHTLMTPICLLAGHKVVADAMTDQKIRDYVEKSIEKGLIPLMEEDEVMKIDFGKKVVDRFANPFIAHELHKIAAQSTLKIRNRILPLIQKGLADTRAIDETLIMGIGAWLALAKVTKHVGGKFYSTVAGEDFEIIDEKASLYWQIWNAAESDAAALQAVISSETLWGDGLECMRRLEDRLMAAAVANLQ